MAKGSYNWEPFKDKYNMLMFAVFLVCGLGFLGMACSLVVLASVRVGGKSDAKDSV